LQNSTHNLKQCMRRALKHKIADDPAGWRAWRIHCG
jgi:hypothetical protein